MRGILSGSLDGEAGDVLQSILANSRDCINVLNAHGELEYVSPSAKSALGLDDNLDAIGRAWREFWPESERSALDAAILAALSGSSTHFEGVMRSREAEERIWEVTVSPVRGEDGTIRRVLTLSTDVTAQRADAERGRQQLQRAETRIAHAGDVARELRHRLKNQLAVVNAVTKLLARHADDVGDLAAKLEAKLIALSRAQDLLAIQRDGPLTADQAVQEVVTASSAGERIVISGIPKVALPEETIQQLALLLGELQTNALKHGALRENNGQVELTGAVDDGVLALRWTETCVGEVVPASDGKGGFQLIRRLGSAGGNRATIAWGPAGIIVDFFVRSSA